ncbi:hypothetical protein EV426DRAFT_635797 [Tirmania nivea]|nr:hypothetical protein EV426DRAFT_635797 [Tirmania nivea]
MEKGKGRVRPRVVGMSMGMERRRRLRRWSWRRNRWKVMVTRRVKLVFINACICAMCRLMERQGHCGLRCVPENITNLKSTLYIFDLVSTFPFKCSLVKPFILHLHT